MVGALWVVIGFLVCVSVYLGGRLLYLILVRRPRLIAMGRQQSAEAEETIRRARRMVAISRHEGDLEQCAELERLIGDLSRFQAEVAALEHPRFSTIQFPPGIRLHLFALRWFSPRTAEEILIPVISDMQEQHAAALAEGDLTKARWVCVRGRLVFCSHLIAHVASIVVTPLRPLVDLWRTF
jgi:hypothetical protein